MTLHSEPHALAGRTARLVAHGADVNGHLVEDAEIRIEDWWDRVYGRSWMSSIGNPAAIIYAMRSAVRNLPGDDEVVYGKVDGYGFLVHVTELSGGRS
jgi:hypothetical protein